MADILVLYSTVDGHTRKICERIAQRIEQHDHRVTLRSLDEQAEIDPGDYARVVIGASIRYGKHRPNVLEFINRHASVLQERVGALFTVNLVARKPNRDTFDTNPYLKKLLKQVSWRPDAMAVFAGKLDYSRYGFWDTQMIRLIMWMTKGPTDASAVVDYTDWDKVDAFADRVGASEFAR
jgi:menaquinone-dependent protoporphyrinogen oxidase